VSGSPTAASTGPPAGAPRIRPGTRRDVGLANWAVAWASGRVAGTGPPNLFLTMGRQRRLYRGWLHFAGRMMPGGTLPRRETELVILRVAHVQGCDYEFDHHVHLGAKAGVTPADVARVQDGPEADGWTLREQAILRAADGLLADDDLDDETWTALRTHLDERRAIEVLLLVGHYRMLATFLTTLRVQPDRARGR
jgi:AhpD family alkylhydroperoxidase